MSDDAFALDLALTEAARPLLAQLYRERLEVFHGLFQSRKAYRLKEVGIDLQTLARAGLCELSNDRVRAKCRVTKFQDMMIVSDTPDYVGNDRVWYPLADESLLLASLIPDCRGERVLDIGCGSGILALAAAANGADGVTAIDLSPRAVAFTRFNAALNGCTRIVARVASLEDFLVSRPFDRILLNPPFVPVPDDTAYMLSGYGGRDGLALPRLLLQRLPAIAHPRTALSMISMSPGDAHLSVLERMFLAAFSARPVRISVLDVYGSVAPIETALAPFHEASTFAAWASWLKERNYTHMHYLLIDAFPSNRFCYQRQNLLPRLEDTEESGTWGAMYRVIDNTRRHAR
jgi:SAM-dependent methyltransferase